MKRKTVWIEASVSKKPYQTRSTTIGKSQIEDLCKRFPQIGEEILKYLDNTTIAKCTLVSKTMHSFIGSQKVFWIRKINKYQHVEEDEIFVSDTTRNFEKNE